MRAGGSIAYVAAEDASLTMPIYGGIFEIAVNTGTDATNPDGSALSHRGSTGGPVSPSPSSPRAIAMVAVPKNTALTMLLGGTIGYDAATSASAVADGVILSGASVTSADDGSATSAPPASDGAGTTIAIDNAHFLSNVSAFGQSVTLNAIGGNTVFDGAASLTASHAIVGTVAAGRTMSTIGDLTLSAGGVNGEGASAGGTIAMSVSGRLSVGAGLTMSADGVAPVTQSQSEASSESFIEDDGSSAGASIHAGSAQLTIAGGRVSVLGNGGLALHADGHGGDGDSAGGGSVRPRRHGGDPASGRQPLGQQGARDKRRRLWRAQHERRRLR